MALQLIWQDGAEFIGITFSLHSEKFRSTAKHLTAIRVKMEMLQQILPLSPAWVVDAAVLYTYHFSFLSLSRSRKTFELGIELKMMSALHLANDSLLSISQCIRCVCVHECAISITIALYLSLWMVSTLLAPFELRVSTTKLLSYTQ